jgi:sugar lactone lactonase YvrE
MTRLAAILAAACLAEAGNSLRYSPATAGDAGAGRGPGILLAVENGLKPWPSGHGETPPPLGSLVSLVASGPNTTATRRVIATNLVDPVWVVGAPEHAYVGLFHPGKVVRVSLINGEVETVAEGLSCPEGVALDNQGFLLYVNENPVGDECKAPFPRKKAAQLTRIDLRTGAQAKVAGLRSSTGGEEGGPHGLAVGAAGKGLPSEFAYVCDCPSEGAALVRVALASGTKTIAANLTSPSGCAVAGNFAFIVERGGTDGQLVSVRLADGKKDILLDNLAGPMGVATDGNYVYVEERHKNRVRRVNLSNGNTEVFATGLNSPIGLGMAYGY